MARGFNEFQNFSPASFLKTVGLWEQALKLDPYYLAPLMGSGYCYAHLAMISDAQTSADYLARAEEIFERSAREAPGDVRTYAV